jgi:hypothetical protein
MYHSPFQNTASTELPGPIGHLTADNIPELRNAYGLVLDQLTPDVHDLANTILKAADETLGFNQFADQHDHDLFVPNCRQLLALTADR